MLERHLKRMAEGCKELGIPFEAEAAHLLDWIKRVMDKNELKEAYIRYTVTAGEDILGLPAGDYQKPNHLLYIKALPKVPDKLNSEGKELQLLSLRRNTPEGTVRFKSLHYMNNILAKRELRGYASAANGAEGLMLTAEEFIAEGIVSNIFLLKTTGSIPQISPQAFFRELPGKWCWSWLLVQALVLKKEHITGSS